MNRNVDVVRFAHRSLGGGDDGRDGAVTVFQNVGEDVMHDIATAGHDATARWVWPGATATAQWLCERGGEWIKDKRVVELGAGTGLLGERPGRNGRPIARA